MVQIHILDDLFGVNFDVFGVNLHFFGCALVGTNFFGGVWVVLEVEFGVFGWWKNGRMVFGEFWDIG